MVPAMAPPVARKTPAAIGPAKRVRSMSVASLIVCWREIEGSCATSTHTVGRLVLCNLE
jgi:hypothetical protein